VALASLTDWPKLGTILWANATTGQFLAHGCRIVTIELAANGPHMGVSVVPR